MPKIKPPYFPNSGMPAFFALCLDFKTFVDDTGTVGDAAGITRSGQMGAGASFDGTNPKYITFSGNSTSEVSFAQSGKNGETTIVGGGSSYSLLCRFKSTSSVSGGLFSIGRTGQTARAGVLYLQSGVLSFSNWGASIAGGGPANNGEWRVGIATYNQSSGMSTLYLDGNQVATGTLFSGLSNIDISSLAYLGAFGNGYGGNIIGSLDGCAYFSRVITPQEIQDWSSDFFHVLRRAYIPEETMQLESRQLGSSANPIIFWLRDSENLMQGKTGANPSLSVSKNGGAFSAGASTITEVSGGYYKIHGSGLETDLNVSGVCYMALTATGAEPKTIMVNVLEGNPFYSWDRFRSGIAQGGTSNTITLDADTQQFTLNSEDGDVYVELVRGVGAGQTCLVESIDWNTKIATISGEFLTNPVNGTSYVLNYYARVDQGVTVSGYASGAAPLQPTVPGRTLDVTSGGCAGIDMANVESPGSTLSLSGTTIKAVLDPVDAATDWEVETGLSFAQSMRVISAACGGILSGAGTGTITIKGAGVGATRVVATTDVSGNRTAITITA